MYEPKAIARRQRVTIEDDDQSVLLIRLQRRERVGERGAERAAPEPLGGAGAEVSCEREPALNPDGLSSEQPSDRGRSALILVVKRRNDARLVERGERALRRVGSKKEALVLDAFIADALDDDGDGLSALLAPSLEPFEAVDDLVATIVGDHDANGELGEIVGREDRRAGSERGVRGGQGRDGHERGGALVGLFRIAHERPQKGARSVLKR